MFAKRARLQNFNHGFGREHAAVRPCNDNQPVRTSAVSRRIGRPVLFCRWRKTPTGSLECRWLTEPVAASSVEEPGISWFIACGDASAACCGIAAAAA
jgi:hypothetical protein